jgi:hypothetical protein
MTLVSKLQSVFLCMYDCVQYHLPSLQNGDVLLVKCDSCMDPNHYAPNMYDVMVFCCCPISWCSGHTTNKGCFEMCIVSENVGCSNITFLSQHLSPQLSVSYFYMDVAVV